MSLGFKHNVSRIRNIRWRLVLLANLDDIVRCRTGTVPYHFAGIKKLYISVIKLLDATANEILQQANDY